MVRNRGELRNGHLESAVTDNRENQLVGPRELRADGCRQAEAHGAKPARVEPQPRLIEADKLRGPHLMLAHVGTDNGLASGKPVDLAHYMLGFDFGGGNLGHERMLRLPVANLSPDRKSVV